MRILRVRLKNLSSLSGEWEIDLSHPAYAADGLFAITGPTGAGKSSILDAICLALYGSTPRLGRLSKGANEILSRRAGDCFAEVTFETPSGRFRCHWSQHRARRRADGELQNPRHEIAEADSGRLIDSSLRGVERQIETLTGMDFGRFTRSMLLAQGAFDTFLRAAPDERAPILEQITGTEVYSRISMRVHERQREERQRLDALTSELDGMSLLSETDEQALRERLDSQTRADDLLGQRLQSARDAIAWLDRIGALEMELTEMAARWVELGAREDNFAPERVRLDRARRALELAGEHAALSARRAELTRDQDLRTVCLADIPPRELGLTQAEAEVHQAQTALTGHQDALARMRPLLRQARALDLRLAELDRRLLADTAAQAERQSARAQLDAAQTQDLTQLTTQRQALDALLVSLESTRSDAALVEQLAGIQGRFDALGQLQTQRERLAAELEAAERRTAKAVLASTELSAGRAARETELAAAQQQLDQQRGALDILLEGRGISAWRDQRSASATGQSRLEQTSETAAALLAARRAIEALREQERQAETDLAGLAQQLGLEAERAAARERELGLLETQLSLVRRVQGFEEARHQLIAGTPCPLCGATEHPFATGEVPLPDETQAALTEARAALEQAREHTAALRVRQAERTKDLEQSSARHAEERARALALETRLSELAGWLGLPEPSAETLLTALPERLDQSRAELVRVDAVLTQADALGTQIEHQRDRLEAARTALAAAELAAQGAAHEKAAAEEAAARLGRASEDLEARWLAALQSAALAVTPYGFVELTSDRLEPVLRDLTARRDGWQARQAERTAYEREIGALESRCAQRALALEQMERELASQDVQLAGLKGERAALHLERQRLLADRDADAEEARLTGLVEQGRTALEQAQHGCADAHQALDRLRVRLAELEQGIARQGELTGAAEDAFADRLCATGFADELDYVAANLDERSRDELARQAQALTEERAALAAREQELGRRLAAERERRLTDQPRAELEQSADRLQAEQKTLHQEIGGLRQRLTDNEALKLRHGERQSVIAAQRLECARWDALHALIGSADGKKYRNFAQGLTFDILLAQANRQLQRMSDRYLLIRDPSQPLELSVIDQDQAGEIRSAKNLSGGESFLVSLALALGLSQMASQNVRVDSLFLDEGFGTLDEDALDTALSTLAGLRRDGKLIGVISHVPALKERIATQIQVIPLRGGRSRIQGPGCSGGHGTLSVPPTNA